MTGTVGELWRYPVKSMQGERCEALEFAARGLAGDRRYALVDRSSGRTLTAKTVGDLLLASARTSGDAVVITLPDGREIEAADPTTSALLSEWLGRDCTLIEATGSVGGSYDMTFDPESDEAELVNIPMVDGTFFDLTPLHVLTTTTLATMRTAFPGSDWNVRRFRPNLLIDMSPDEAAVAISPKEPIPPGTAHRGFPEDGWVGAVVPVGTQGAAFQVLMPAVRCAIPNRAQPSLDRDVAIFRAMNAVHANHLGMYCTPAGDGMIRVGDTVAHPD